jgi:hypothetical protein
MGEWSPITYKAEWIDGAAAPDVGNRFKGYNRMPPASWWTVCEVTASEPGKVFEFRTIRVSAPFSIGAGGDREMTRWRYTFEPDGIGTRVTESYEVAFVPPILAIPERLARAVGAGRFVDRRRAKTDAGMVETLRRIKRAAEDGVAGE